MQQKGKFTLTTSARQRQNTLISLFLHMAIIAYGACSCFLYYRQTLWTDGAVYESDLPAHIRMVIEDGWYYSLTAGIYKILYFLPSPNLAIAIFLAAATTGAVYASAALLSTLSGLMPKESPQKASVSDARIRKNLCLLGGLILNLVMPCFIKGFSDGRYIGMQSANIWHNSTYLVMKPLAVLCVILYLQIESRIRQNISVKKLLLFCAALAVTTAVKPSFITVFAPAMLLFLIADLISGVPFGRLFCFGLCVVPSLAVILIQNAILFGASTGEGWTIAPGAVLRMHSGYPAAAAVLSVLFPLLAALFYWKDLLQKTALFICLMGLIGFAELFLFSETGKRAQDGNFMWGYSFSLLLMFAGTLILWWKKLISFLLSRHNAPRLTACRLFFCTVALAYHLYCGLLFFTRLLQGVSYYMWT